ncbi:MAG TPA: HK97 family phage prohead protease, partial [Candidatus Limnocylindrales bacterium]
SALRASHAWVDPNGDPAVKASYKFIHHMVMMDGSVGAANTIGCSTGIGYLNHPPGTTGRPNIPAGDRAGVYAHLAAHIKDADMEPPELTRTLPNGREVRIATEAWPLEELEIRAEGDGMTFRGYAAVFGKPSEDLGGFRETIRPGAFAKTLTEKRAIKMFWNHNTDIPLGSTRSGLTLTEDAKGLLAEGRLPDTSAGRDMSVLIRDHIVDSMSFGFQTVKDSWSEDLSQRELIEARLFEVSPVTAWPAYPQTSASVRELAAEIEAEPDTLAEAFRVLREPEGRLSDEQHQLLVTLINARHASAVMPVALASWRERFAAKGLTAV